jgi:hypothetical protein
LTTFLHLNRDWSPRFSTLLDKNGWVRAKTARNLNLDVSRNCFCDFLADPGSRSFSRFYTNIARSRYLEWLDVTVREIRKEPSKVFGGIQLIFIGDFAQLSPVVAPKKDCRLEDAPKVQPGDDGADVPCGITGLHVWAFQTVMWREARFKHVLLQTVHRQNDSDPSFKRALNSVRKGRWTDDVRHLIEGCRVPLSDREGASRFTGEPTKFYAWNKDVDHENAKQLEKLPGSRMQFDAVDSVSVDLGLPPGTAADPVDLRQAEAELEKELGKVSALQEKLILKVDAEVMLVQNRVEHGVPPAQRLVNGSRGTIIRFERLDDGHTEMPVVKFTNGREEVIDTVSIENELSGRGTYTRNQLPLKLAWALTIDKSQGATLDHVVLDLSHVQRDGQAYVGMSRCRTRAGLQIIAESMTHSETANCLKASALVQRFYDSITGGGDDAVGQFLVQDAGLWWYPLLPGQPGNAHPGWLRLFSGAKGNRVASDQFSNWMMQYPPSASTATVATPTGALATPTVSAPPVPVGATSMDIVLTTEQQRRMAENKRRGLKLRAQRLRAQPRCKQGCMHSVAPGTTRSGTPFDTCCRPCAVNQCSLQLEEHTLECQQRYAAERVVECTRT